MYSIFVLFNYWTLFIISLFLVLHFILTLLSFSSQLSSLVLFPSNYDSISCTVSWDVSHISIWPNCNFNLQHQQILVRIQFCQNFSQICDEFNTINFVNVEIFSSHQLSEHFSSCCSFQQFKGNKATFLLQTSVIWVLIKHLSSSIDPSVEVKSVCQPSC